MGSKDDSHDSNAERWRDEVSESGVVGLRIAIDREQLSSERRRSLDRAIAKVRAQGGGLAIVWPAEESSPDG